MYNAILIRYDEIALKGANRIRFENLLLENMTRALADVMPLVAKRERGRFVLFPAHSNSIPSADLDAVCERLRTVFGLSSFSPGILVDSTVDAIEGAVYASFGEHYQAVAQTIPEPNPIAYRLRVRRADKSFPLKSTDFEIRFADKLLEEYERLKVDLVRPSLKVGVEIRKKWSFIFYSQIDGAGGLPSGCNESALGLLSGGIDSPVACYLTMKRGTPMNFLTFHSYPYTPKDSVMKVVEIVRLLNRRQKSGKSFSCNLSESQKIIRDECSQKFRTILYRRLMLRVSAQLADSLGCRALVTGDAVGQVASQTLTNMAVIDQATDMLVLRPLAGMDKLEITALARSIGTYNISSKNCPDSCTVFSPRSPSTRASLRRIQEEEERIDIPRLLEQLMSTIKIVDVKSGREHDYRLG